MKKDKIDFFTLIKILNYNAKYNIIIGERSNGKTYACLEYAIKKFVEKGEQFIYLRRYDEALKRSSGSKLFDSLIDNDVIAKITKGEFDTVTYRGREWYLSRYDEELKTEILSAEPCAYGLALNIAEHYKSYSYPKVTTVIFDEFLSREGCLTDEFVIFMNVLSTIIRGRTDVTIFMLGNTVNKYSPYFAEMGLTDIRNMKKGDIQLYRYGESELSVAVQFSDSISKKGKPSDFYFAFGNPRLKMITGGDWELDIYPHCPQKFEKKDIIFIYFIVFAEDTLQCEIVQKGSDRFTFIHRKTTDLKNNQHDLIYTTAYDSKPNYRRKINMPASETEKKIYSFYKMDKIFYQDNEVGEIVRNYLNFCRE